MATDSITIHVTINGFSVVKQTYDDTIRTDGKDDEVSIEARICNRDATGNKIPGVADTSRITKVMGDMEGRTDRIKAGSSHSSFGGIKSGDTVPSPLEKFITGATKLYQDFLPMVVYHGTLEKGQHAVAITPTIIEVDNQSKLATGFGDVLSVTVDVLAGLLKALFGDLITAAIAKSNEAKTRGGSTDGGVVFEEVATSDIYDYLTGRKLGIGRADDRPIGIQKIDGNYRFRPKILVLTYDTAKELVATDFGDGKGVLALRYTDKEAFEGDYILYMQVREVDSEPGIRADLVKPRFGLPYPTSAPD
jgi:hypothetical protein